jgi:transcriptional regulator with XRE-family HTH domain
MYLKFEGLINEKGITAYRVAKDIGISPGTLSDWKHGRSRPKADKLKQLADYFGVTVEYFLD